MFYYHILTYITYFLQEFVSRVTNSFSGILNSSWIPGFLRNDSSPEDDTANVPEATPGPSGYIPPLDTKLETRSLYPEEGMFNAFF